MVLRRLGVGPMLPARQSGGVSCALSECSFRDSLHVDRDNSLPIKGFWLKSIVKGKAQAHLLKFELTHVQLCCLAGHVAVSCTGHGLCRVQTWAVFRVLHNVSSNLAVRHLSRNGEPVEGECSVRPHYSADTSQVHMQPGLVPNACIQAQMCQQQQRNSITPWQWCLHMATVSATTEPVIHHKGSSCMLLHT
jgi:hypothetical protein